MTLIHSPGRRAGKTSECEKHCDYWWRFKRWDGNWSSWMKVDLTRYAQLRQIRDMFNGPDVIETRVTKKGETP